MRFLLVVFYLFWIACNAQVGNFVSEKNLPITKVSSFTGTDNYYTGDNTGAVANLTGFSVWLVVDPSHNENTNVWEFIFGRSNTNTSKTGWSFVKYQGAISFCIDGTFQANFAGEPRAQSINTSWGEMGRLQILHGVIRNNVIYLYKNGVVTGSGIPKPSIDFGTPTAGISFGAYKNPISGNYYQYEGGIIAAGIASSTGWSDQQVKDHFLAIQSNAYALAPNATNFWKAPDAGATWTDTIGGLVATKIGSPAISSGIEACYIPYDPSIIYGDKQPILPQLPNTAGSLDIMAIGASQTIGGGCSWRYICEIGKSAAGMSNLTWVGPKTITTYFNDRFNAAGGTVSIDAINGTNGITSDITTTMNTYDPDVVVIWEGHNALDTQSQQPLKGDLETLILMIHSLKPNCRFLILTEINNVREGTSIDAKEKDYAKWLLTYEISKLKNMGLKIIAVDIVNSLFWSDDIDWFDTVHPAVPSPISATMGYNKVGAVVWPALRLICGYN